LLKKRHATKEKKMIEVPVVVSMGSLGVEEEE
jgi:hypothetical protein